MSKSTIAHPDSVLVLFTAPVIGKGEMAEYYNGFLLYTDWTKKELNKKPCDKEVMLVTAETI